MKGGGGIQVLLTTRNVDDNQVRWGWVVAVLTCPNFLGGHVTRVSHMVLFEQKRKICIDKQNTQNI